VLPTLLGSLNLTPPDALGVTISVLVLLIGVAAALRSSTRVGRFLWRLMLAGAILGGVLAQLRYADGQCSWVVGWPFAVTRVQTNCGDVWSEVGPSVLARIGDIVVAMAAVLLAGSSLPLVRRGRPTRDDASLGGPQNNALRQTRHG
jgi:hypothetical protein